MKHVTYASKDLLIGSEIADVLMEYAAQLACDGGAESVEVSAVSGDGDDVVATFLLGAGAPMMVETSNTSLPEPDNDELVRRLRAEMVRRANPALVQAEDQVPASTFDFDSVW